MKWGRTSRLPWALGAALVASCGGTTDLPQICGPGTHDEGGTCLPDVTCGAGTVEANGECVAVAVDAAVPLTDAEASVPLADAGASVPVIHADAAASADAGLRVMTDGAGPDGSGTDATASGDAERFPDAASSLEAASAVDAIGFDALDSADAPVTDDGADGSGPVVRRDAGASTSESICFSIDPAHTNAQLNDAVASPLEPSWTVTFTGPPSIPIITQGQVIIEADESQPNVRALDLTTGAVVWGSDRPRSEDDAGL
jgi:hypothetical protein